MTKRYIFGILFVFILFVLLTLGSYYRSKLAAEELVGDTIEYFQLSQTKITIEPLERNQIVWSFKFSYLDTRTFDEEFYIYTSLWGSVVTTNPTNLENMIRESEKLDVHPYDKKQGGMIERLKKRAQNEDIYIVAAQTGDAQAQYELGKIYAEGELIERDRDLAKKLFLESAENGNADAQVVLSLMYHLGSLGFPCDQIQTYAWAAAAARQGRKNSRGIADDIIRELGASDSKKAKDLAEEYYKLYVEPFHETQGLEQRLHNGNDISQYESDSIYTEENAKKRIPPPGTTYIERAKNGDSNAQVALSMFYSSGNIPGYPLDLVQAYAWAVAAEKGDEGTRNMANDIMEDLDSEGAIKAKALAEEFYKLYVKPFEEK